MPVPLSTILQSLIDEGGGHRWVPDHAAGGLNTSNKDIKALRQAAP